MATIETLLVRNPGQTARVDGIVQQWRKIKVPTKYLFNSETSEHLSRDLNAEVVTCLVQTTSSVFIFYRYKQGKLLRKIEIDEDFFSTEGVEETWERGLFEDGEGPPSVGGNVIRGLEEGLGLQSISQVPEIKIAYQLPKSITSEKSSWFRTVKIIFYFWVVASLLIGGMMALFNK